MLTVEHPCPVCEKPKRSFELAKRVDGRTMCGWCWSDVLRLVGALGGTKTKDTWADIKAQRQRLLKETDHWEFPSKRKLSSPEDLKEIDEYRQALRDLPEDFIFPKEVAFPQKPDL